MRIELYDNAGQLKNNNSIYSYEVQHTCFEYAVVKVTSVMDLLGHTIMVFGSNDTVIFQGYCDESVEELHNSAIVSKFTARSMNEDYEIEKLLSQHPLHKYFLRQRSHRKCMILKDHVGKVTLFDYLAQRTQHDLTDAKLYSAKSISRATASCYIKLTWCYNYSISSEIDLLRKHILTEYPYFKTMSPIALAQSWLQEGQYLCNQQIYVQTAHAAFRRVSRLDKARNRIFNVFTFDMSKSALSVLYRCTHLCQEVLHIELNQPSKRSKCIEIEVDIAKLISDGDNTSTRKLSNSEVGESLLWTFMQLLDVYLFTHASRLLTLTGPLEVLSNIMINEECVYQGERFIVYSYKKIHTPYEADSYVELTLHRSDACEHTVQQNELDIMLGVKPDIKEHNGFRYHIEPLVEPSVIPLYPDIQCNIEHLAQDQWLLITADQTLKNTKIKLNFKITKPRLRIESRVYITKVNHV